MYRVRMHGRGGQGVKTAMRVLGTALFRQGLEVQDAPRYGAERRGAPIFAYLRADTRAIAERGVIDDPGLVIVVDDTLMEVPAAGVQTGLGGSAVLLVATDAEHPSWQRHLALGERVVMLAKGSEPSAHPLTALRCAAAAARLLGCVSRDALGAAIEEELASLGAAPTRAALGPALATFDAMAQHAGKVPPAPPRDVQAWAPPEWIELEREGTCAAAPSIHATATSVLVPTGLWRTHRPVLNPQLCHGCHWVCGGSCPDGVITPAPDSTPKIDLDHCKGCMICVAQCPFHALGAIAEADARGQAS